MGKGNVTCLNEKVLMVCCKYAYNSPLQNSAGDGNFLFIFYLPLTQST